MARSTYPQPTYGRIMSQFGGSAHCIYCGKRCAPSKLACWKHADLPALDDLSPELLARVSHYDVPSQGPAK